MKKFNLILLVISSLYGSAAFSKTEILVDYRKSADIFEIMDNTSDWWPGFTDSAYKDYWKEKFTLSKEDEKLFERYKKLREKYYNDPDQKPKDPLKNRNGFFSTIGSADADPVAEAFYSSRELKEAFQKLSKILSKEELEFLELFYSHFSANYSKILIESNQFQKLVDTTRNGINKKGLNEYLSKVSNFYGVRGDVKYQTLFVWWPPLSRTKATPTGDYLIMRYNPTRHAENDDTDIVMHEVVHTISRRQSQEQKRKFTKEFLGICNVGGSMKKLKILEEPLAVANGQMLYQETFQPERFKHADKWYNDSWISMFGKLIYPTVKSYIDQNKSMDIGFIKATAHLCNEVLSASKNLK